MDGTSNIQTHLYYPMGGKEKCVRRCLFLTVFVNVFIISSLLPNSIHNTEFIPGEIGYVIVGSLVTLSIIIGGTLGDTLLGPYKVIVGGTILNFIGMLSIELYNILFLTIRHLNKGTLEALDAIGCASCSIGFGLAISCTVQFIGFHCENDKSREREFLWYCWYVNFAVWLWFLPATLLYFVLDAFDEYRLYDTITGVIRLSLLISAISTLIYAKKKGWFKYCKPQGKEQFWILVNDHIPSLWRRTTDMSVIKRFLLYLGVIISALIVHEMIWTQIYLTIKPSITDHLNCLCNTSCMNTTLQCENSEGLHNVMGSIIISFSPLTVIAVIPFIQCIKIEDLSSIIAKYKRYQTVICAGMLFSGLAMIFAVIYSHLEYILFEISVWWLLPTCICIGIAEVATIRGVYIFAFTEAQDNLPGLECIYTSLASMCFGTGGMMALGIYHICRTVHGGSLTFIETVRSREYYYITLMVLSLTFPALLIIQSRIFNRSVTKKTTINRRIRQINCVQL